MERELKKKIQLDLRIRVQTYSNTAQRGNICCPLCYMYVYYK